MRATLALTRAYFSATPLTRGLTVLGILLMIGGIAGYWLAPVTLFPTNPQLEFTWLDYLVLPLPWLGLVLLLAATALMPAMVERVMLGRGVWVLPGGRVKLLASVVVTAALLAVLTATSATVVFLDFPPEIEIDLGRIFYRTLLMAFVDFGLIYIAIWFVGKASGVWRLVGLLWAVVSITIPFRYLGGGIAPFSLLEAFGVAIWIMFGGLALSGGRLRHSLHGVRMKIRRLAGHLLPTFGYAPGNEIALLLGTARPWIVAIGQTVPVAVLLWFVRFPPVWIVFLVTFSAISGAITSQAASKGRRLWLRYDWTRAQIHRRVELAYLRYNAWSVCVLLLLYAAFSLYLDFELQALLLGISLILLGSAASHYLGLTVTRELGWFESALGVLTMVTLTLGAFAIVREQWTAAIELQVLLAALTIVFRLMGRTRWLDLDWMRCRPA